MEIEKRHLPGNYVSSSTQPFIYFITTPVSKIACYFNRLSRALKLTSLYSKTYVFLNFVEKYVRLKWKKKANVIITIIIEYAWICINVP